MIRRRWILLLIVAAVILALCYDRTIRTEIVQHFDVHVEFIITDAITGQPIPDATIYVQSSPNSNNVDYEHEFVLTTNSNGRAHREFLKREYTATRSLLGFSNRAVMFLPCWEYRVAAQDYPTTEWTNAGEKWHLDDHWKRADGTVSIALNKETSPAVETP